MTLGERIAYYRKKAGYSQEGLAERLGVSRQAISKWETGEATPDAERIIALAAALGISSDTLLLGKEEPERPYTEAILPGILWRRMGWGSCWWGCWRASALAVFFPCRTVRGACRASGTT